jgi:CO/xanthine dehydrogenase Mo-binding subunit
MERDELLQELEQHEVSGILHWFTLDRRDFLKVFGGGLLVCAAAPAAIAQESGRGGFGGHELPKDVQSWLHITPDGAVTVMTGKVEVGQNIRTSLAQAVAEQLRVPVGQISMVMGDTSLTPWDAGTFGSRTTPTMAPILRRVAATARELLIDTAAKRWSVDRSKLVARDGRIVDPSTNKSAGYGELTKGEQLTQVISAGPPETPATEWKIAGTPVAKVNGREVVTGRHRYPSDIVRPGMLFGKVLRPAGFGAELVSLDTAAAEAMPGVRIVHDGNFIGVVAPDRYTAEKAVKAIEAKWNVSPGPSNANLFEYLKANTEEGRGRDTRPVGRAGQDTGDFEKALAAAPVKLESTYTVQYIAHTPLEPRAAVAEWNGDKLTVWTGTQRPFAVRDELVEAFRVPQEKVRVIQPDMGSGYGGKHTGDAAVEAARLARAAGKPVKLVWTREEEFTWAYFRPAGVIEVRSGAQRDGTIAAWGFHNYNSGPAGLEPQYEIANRDVQFHPVKSPLRQGSYRALAATANNFARESHIDELAHAVGMDPLAFRLKNLKNERVIAVLQAAADRFGWKSRKSTPDVGVGMACGTEKGGFYAACVEVETRPMVRIRRVVEAFECGAVVNPNGLRNQTEGAIIQGIGGALFEAIQFADNKILNPRLNDYPVPRFRDVPQIEVVILDRKDLPSVGAGEAPICALAPAVGNAIFAATGTRVRHMPMAPDGSVRTS